MQYSADDGIFVFAGKNRQENQDKIEENFKKIKRFLNSNGLAVNDTKTTLSEVMSKQKRGRLRGTPPSLVVQTLEDGEIKDKKIENKHTCRFLGMNLEGNQSWKAHLLDGKKAILPAIKRRLGAIYSLRDTIPFKSRLIIANAIIIGGLTYGIPLWGGATDKHLRRAQAVMNWGGEILY